MSHTIGPIGLYYARAHRHSAIRAQDPHTEFSLSMVRFPLVQLTFVSLVQLTFVSLVQLTFVSISAVETNGVFSDSDKESAPVFDRLPGTLQASGWPGCLQRSRLQSPILDQRSLFTGLAGYFPTHPAGTPEQ